MQMIEHSTFGPAMSKHLENAGFAAPAGRALGQERQTANLAALGASVGIAVCTVVAATVVSVGIARADGVANILDNEGGLFALALLLGVAFIVMGGLSALPHLPHLPRKHRH
jgi:hypothetical protein